MPITDWPAAERPREKLLLRGAAALSDAELLAIFLRTGTRGLTAVDLARTLLREFGSLHNLFSADRKRFCRSNGLGDAKYAQLQAVLEMARRHLQESIEQQDALTCPDDTRNYLKSRLSQYGHEVFACLFLDNRHRVLHFQEMFRGTIDGATVHPREVVKRALELNAAALIVAHNHPSGVTEPSLSDELITQQLKKALDLVDIRLLDHIIVGSGMTTSLAERGLI